MVLIFRHERYKYADTLKNGRSLSAIAKLIMTSLLRTKINIERITGKSCILYTRMMESLAKTDVVIFIQNPFYNVDFPNGLVDE